MKTKEELSALKAEIDAIKTRLAELSEDELAQVAGGINLTTSSENVQAAESTFRDADMAKEMTEFTKNNILLQTAQAMLAQANQTSQSNLSLLQKN